jgi:Serine/threonine protein kinase
MSQIKNYQEEYDNFFSLGKGGNAEVFLARHRKFGYTCTVRRLLEPVKDEKSEKYQKFINECRRLLLLDSGGHAHIARINKPQLLYNDDCKTNMACVEMEYIKGENIFEFLKREDGFIPSSEVVNFIKNIGSALSYCHFEAYEFLADKDIEYTYELDSELKGQTFKVKTGKDRNKLNITPLQEQELVSLFKVTHNDIHEGNIIRKCDGNYILIDFGLAAFGHEGARTSIIRQGAREYWAPERFDGIFSEQTDIYSFGILAYQMLTNNLPYTYREEDRANSYEGEESQLHRKHADPNISIPAIEPLRKATCEAVGKKWTGKDYPAWLEQVIMKCLEKKPEKRYANGKELYEDIESQIKNATKTPYIEEVEKIKIQNEKLSDQIAHFNDQIYELTFYGQTLSEELEKQNKTKSDQISKLTLRNQKLSEDLEKLKTKKKETVVGTKIVEKIVEKKVFIEKKVAKPLWVALTITFFIISIGLGGAIFLQSDDHIYNQSSSQSHRRQDAEIERLNAQVEDLNKQLSAKEDNSAMRKIVGDKDREIANLRQQINQLNADKTSLQNQLATARSNSGGNSTSSQNQINSLNSKVSSLEKQITDKDTEITRLRRALASALGQ